MAKITTLPTLAIAIYLDSFEEDYNSAPQVQEKASGALWALSGNDPTKRRDIGTKIGIEMLIVLLESKSEKIQ